VGLRLATSGGVGANWLGVTEKGTNNLEVWFQPTGGHVYKATDFKVDGSHLTLNLAPGRSQPPGADVGTWGQRRTAHRRKRGENSLALTGVRAPELKRSAPKAWANPEPLFNGKNLEAGNRSAIRRQDLNTTLASTHPYVGLLLTDFPRATLS
jgi:hypothetical protein